jgi:hypothetical protein
VQRALLREGGQLEGAEAMADVPCYCIYETGLDWTQLEGNGEP